MFIVLQGDEMDNNETLESIFCSTFQIEKDKISDDARPENTEAWDSISHMELISKMEEAFVVNFDASEIASMDSVKEIKKVLRKHGVDL